MTLELCGIYHMQVQSKIILCKSECICQHSVIKITVARLQNILKIIRILFLSTIQTRNKMDDKIYQNQFYFAANAQLFDSSESNEILQSWCQTIGRSSVYIRVKFDDVSAKDEWNLEIIRHTGVQTRYIGVQDPRG